MPISITTESSESYRHRIEVDDRHELLTDLPKSLGGDDSAPGPHDYFDTALGACKALTLMHYARAHDIPLTGVTVEVSHDSSQEKDGRYALTVELTLKGVLDDTQRATLRRVADRCPVHRLMTTSEVTIETRLAQGAYSQ